MSFIFVRFVDHRVLSVTFLEHKEHKLLLEEYEVMFDSNKVNLSDLE